MLGEAGNDGYDGVVVEDAGLPGVTLEFDGGTAGKPYASLFGGTCGGAINKIPNKKLYILKYNY